LAIVESITVLFLKSPLLLLFATLGLGHVVGRIKIGSFSLGASAILFVGLALSALHPNLMLPEMIYQLGLVFFVYAVGLASGPAFFASFRHNGLRDSLFVIAMLCLATALTLLSARLMNLAAPIAAGLFSGSLTNTPAVAGVVEALKGQVTGLTDALGLEQILAQPIIGYSLTYPIGVIGVILSIYYFSRLFRVDFAKEHAALTDGNQPQYPVAGEIFLVSEHACVDQTVQALERRQIFIQQIRRGDKLIAVEPDTVLQLGDLVTVAADRTPGHTVREVLGDSFKELAEVDLPATALGISIGLVVGLIPIPLPGGIRFHLGFAGGPLLVALVLGNMGKSGPLLWRMPPGINQTLRHLGISLFLAGIGTRAGYAFISTLQELGPLVVLTGAAVTFTYSALTIVLGYKFLKMPMSVLSGLLAGMQTQPAALVFAEENARSDAPYIGYATAYPVAMVAKIILAQVLLNLLM